jgi:hypothetical protein
MSPGLILLNVAYLMTPKFCAGREQRTSCWNNYDASTPLASQTLTSRQLIGSSTSVDSAAMGWPTVATWRAG